MAAPLDEYLESKVMTATAHQLHLMVVDGAIQNAVIAERALQSGDIASSHLPLNRARRFVAEIITGLDSSHLPELVENLKALFLFVHRSLVQAGVKHDPTKAADSVKILRLHRETWLALGERLKQESTIRPSIAESSAVGSGVSWLS